jgi:D-alanine-D-alanine ligase-like ATP-grasp enzyme
MCCQLSANIIGAWGKLECQVKPARGGSSMGVSVANGMESAVRKAQALITEGVDTRVVIEMFAEGGREFTAIVLDVGTGNVSRPVTLLPTEVKNHLISCEVSHMGTWA